MKLIDIDTVTQLPPLKLDLGELRKGINNYHVDVRISPRFAADVRRLVSALMQQATVPNAPPGDYSAQFNALRASYLEVMTSLLHRVKTDLSSNSIQLLEFALLKFMLATSRAQLEEIIAGLKARSSEAQERASANALLTNQRLFWLQKNHDSILFDVNRQLFAQLERVETRQLAEVRSQYLPMVGHAILELRLNPMLCTGAPADSAFLIDQYRLWGGDGEDAGFNVLNDGVETLLGLQLPDLAIAPLMAAPGAGAPELYDELGGLFQTQRFLGLASDTKGELSEQFSWLESPANLEALFAISRQIEALRETRRAEGLGAWWQARKRVMARRRALSAFTAQWRKKRLFKLLVASRQVKALWTPVLAEQIEGRFLCQFLSGQIDRKKLQARALNGHVFTPEQWKQFAEAAKTVKQEAGAHALESTLAILQDICRFRLHLKYFRLAHRAFNRLRILRSEEDLKLSREAGSLYSLLTPSEQQDDQDRIVHHAIIKADVRGSTTVTEELQAKSLNPASYFSLRFFSPINALLPIYGAGKVFIEGDAVILSLLEHEKSPQQWFAVARACGLARAMLNVVHANNLHSEQMGLPKLEVGIGLCYAPTAPLYLYDEDKPIMISGAIGKADRLSSCTWKLRRIIQPGVFNVEVFALADGEPGRGEKGQNTIRYNVNGILLDNAGFEKLQQEITLRRVSVRLNGEAVTLHVGKFPDLNGKSHDLVIREGRVRLWRDEAPVEGHLADERFYEVVSNRKLITQLTAPRT